VLTTKNTPWVEIKKTNSGWYIKNDHNHLLRQLKKIFKLNLYSFKKKSFNAINLSKKYNWNCLAKQYLCVYKKLLNH
jgi:hypothetical protein